MNVTVTLLHGHVFMKHGRSGWPHRRLVWIDATGAELGVRWGKPSAGQDVTSPDEWISLGDTVAVEKGRATQTLRKSGKAKKDDLYWSIVGRTRSLDLECHTKEERDAFAGGFATFMREPGLLQDTMMWLFKNGHWAPPGLEDHPDRGGGAGGEGEDD